MSPGRAVTRCSSGEVATTTLWLVLRWGGVGWGEVATDRYSSVFKEKIVDKSKILLELGGRV